MTPRLFKTASGLRAFLASRPAQAFDLLVLHDAPCSPSRCVCLPWYEVRALTADAHVEGVRLEREWRRAVAS